MIVVTELKKKTSQKIVMFNLFHVQVSPEGFNKGGNDANAY